MAKKQRIKASKFSNGSFVQFDQMDKLTFYVIAFMILIIPIIVYYHDATNIVIPKIDYSGSGIGYKDDIFSYNKFILLSISTVILSLIIIMKFIFLKYPIIETKLNWVFAALFVFVPLSALFSPFKSVASWGMYYRYEGAITLFSMLFLVWVIVNTHFKESHMLKIIFFTSPFILVNTFLGLLNFYGIKLLSYSFVRHLIGIPDVINISDSEFSSTLQNQNFLSGVSGFLFILYFTLMIFHKKLSIKILSFLSAFLAFINVLLSISTSGFLTIIVLIPFILILACFYIRGSWKLNLIFVVSLFLISTSTLVFLSKHNQRVRYEFIQPITNLSNQIVSSEKSLITQTENDSNTSTQSESVSNGDTSINEPSDKKNDDFLPQLPKAGVSGGSGRIYMWKSVIESWKKSPLIGYGMDTTSYYLNQDDIQMVSGLGSYDVVIDRPHNFYLGILAGAGLLTFIPLVILFGYLVVRFVQAILIKTENVYVIVFGFSALAFFIQAIFNDLVVETDIIYWVFIGLLANQLVRAKINT
ncbi:MAG: O-Antigen ligase family protein [Bacillales bacterium]|jgi:hypothetical protein|nr:O-Antigen ligase family protein [Bacillales bacterium]